MRRTPTKDERCFLGTGIYRVNFIDAAGKSRWTPRFARVGNARRALEIVRAKGFQAIIVR